MTEEQADRLGRVADQLDNLLHASKMKLPAELHLQGLLPGIREARDEIAAVVKDITGQDPWEGNPLAG